METKEKRTYNFYDSDGVNRRLKAFVVVFNDFVNHYNRVPSPAIENEKKLYKKWKYYTDFNNLNEAEIEYINKNLIKVDERLIEREIEDYTKQNNVREVVKKLVEELNDFVEENKRLPSYKIESENPLYTKFKKYTNPVNANSAEINYIEKYLNKKYMIRKAIIELVQDFNRYFVENKRIPGANSALYQRWNSYRTLEGLTEAEINYYINNIAFLGVDHKDGVSENVKIYVGEYNLFVKTHKRVPTSTPKRKEERILYRKHLYYSKPENCSENDRKYIDMFLVKKLVDDNFNDSKIPFIRPLTIMFVEEYNDYVIKYGKHPTQYDNIDCAASLYQRWIKYFKNKENVTDDEIVYMEENLLRRPNVRKTVYEFVEAYLAFVKQYGRTPSNYVKRSHEEKTLATRAYNYKYNYVLTKDEIELLLQVGIDVEACRRRARERKEKSATI